MTEQDTAAEAAHQPETPEHLDEEQHAVEQEQQADGEQADGESGPEAEPGEAQQETLVDEQPARTPEELQAALEALLMVAEEPISETNLAAALRVPVEDVRTALQALVDFYAETGRGFELRSVAGGWRYYTREEHADLISGYLLEGQQAKLSQAALETLAVVAYLQPVSRSRVSAVRGVNVDGVMRTLVNRDLVAEIGSEESGATLFATTDYFLERMGLDSLDQLPELAPHLPEAAELEAELGQLAVVADQPESSPEPVAEVETEPLPEPVEGSADPGELEPTDEIGIESVGSEAEDGTQQQPEAETADAAPEDQDDRG